MITDERVERYLHRLHAPKDPVVRDMQSEGERRGFPIIGPLVGGLCEILARSVGARRVFEMGSGFGYSTWWFARAVGEDGEVVHTDGDAANTEAAREWLGRAGVADRVRFETGDALDILRRVRPSRRGPFDIVFIDVDKGDYPECWRLARERVRVGGLVIADNTLWQGKVADGRVRDEWTRAIRQYGRLATADEAFLTRIIPLRDGVAVSLRVA